jgi:signal transduction histidine kinase
MPGIVKGPRVADRRPGGVAARGETSDGSLPVDLLGRLGWLCDAFHAQSGIDCRLEARPEHAHLDPAAGDVLYRTLRELYVLYKRAQTRRIVVASELRDDGSVAFHVSFDSDGAQPRISPLECDAVALWDIDQRLREVGAYLELRNEPGICTTVVFPRQLVVPR